MQRYAGYFAEDLGIMGVLMIVTKAGLLKAL
jgi:hypothetical protein